MIKSWSDDAWAEYVYWLSIDKSKIKKINDLIKSIERDGSAFGLGKPEPLKNADGAFSRRIDQEHRLVYKISEQNDQPVIFILSCRGHYDD